MLTYLISAYAVTSSLSFWSIYNRHPHSPQQGESSSHSHGLTGVLSLISVVFKHQITSGIRTPTLVKRHSIIKYLQGEVFHGHKAAAFLTNFSELLMNQSYFFLVSLLATNSSQNLVVITGASRGCTRVNRPTIQYVALVRTYGTISQPVIEHAHSFQPWLMRLCLCSTTVFQNDFVWHDFDKWQPLKWETFHFISLPFCQLYSYVHSVDCRRHHLQLMN